MENEIDYLQRKAEGEDDARRASEDAAAEAEAEALAEAEAHDNPIGDFERAVLIRDEAEAEMKRALVAIPKAFEEAVAAQSIIFAQASERAFREHVAEFEAKRGKA